MLNKKKKIPLIWAWSRSAPKCNGLCPTPRQNIMDIFWVVFALSFSQTNKFNSHTRKRNLPRVPWFSFIPTCFFQIGDRVMAFVNYNAWAEVVCTPVDFVYKMPDDMSFAEAAAFALNFVAAYMMLFEVANLREGMSVLVHSAGGGVVSPPLMTDVAHAATKRVQPFHPALIRTDCFLAAHGASCLLPAVNVTVHNENINFQLFLSSLLEHPGFMFFQMTF